MNNKIIKHKRLKKLLFATFIVIALGIFSVEANRIRAESETLSDVRTWAHKNKTNLPKNGIQSKLRKKAKTGSKTFVLGASQDTSSPNLSSSSNNITVHYIDKKGTILTPNQVLKGEVGSDYKTIARKIPGYILVFKSDNTSGVFNNKPQNVTYVYKKNDKIVNQSSRGIAFGEADAKIFKKAKKALSNYKTRAVAHAQDNLRSHIDLHIDNEVSNKLPQTSPDKSIKRILTGLGFLSIFGGLIGVRAFCRKGKISF